MTRFCSGNNTQLRRRNSHILCETPVNTVLSSYRRDLDDNYPVTAATAGLWAKSLMNIENWRGHSAAEIEHARVVLGRLQRLRDYESSVVNQ